MDRWRPCHILPYCWAQRCGREVTREEIRSRNKTLLANMAKVSGRGGMSGFTPNFGPAWPPANDVRGNARGLGHRTFETAIIERYRRRESSVEEALINSPP